MQVDPSKLRFILACMIAPTRKIEIAEVVAAELESRAAAEGTSIATIIARLVESDREAPSLSEEEVGELDRQWDALQAGAPTVSHEDVEAWLCTWGTPDFKPWNHR